MEPFLNLVWSWTFLTVYSFDEIGKSTFLRSRHFPNIGTRKGSQPLKASLLVKTRASPKGWAWRRGLIDWACR